MDRSAAPPGTELPTGDEVLGEFVLLEHAGAHGVHWDLMLAVPGRAGLATWQLPANPLLGRGPIAARPLGDHRRAYLTFEGDIGGGRGVVRRVDAGAARIRRGRGATTLVELRGALWRETVELADDGAGGLPRRRPATGGNMDLAAYDAFRTRVRDLSAARSVEALLDWDQETQMPPHGAEDRANQLALLAGIVHERLTSDELGALLEQLTRDGAVDDPDAAVNVREIRRDFERAIKLPTDLVREIARSAALAKDAWVGARRDSDFSAFAPHLEHLLDLKRRMADHIGWTTERYDALLDEYEPGARAADIERVFAGVRTALVPLVRDIAAAPRRPDLTILERHCPVAAQAEFNRTLAGALGFSFDAGRIDTSVHPFCSGLTPRDVRLTTRYDERYMPMSLFGILHEAGHGMYEQGLPAEHTGTPLAQAASLGIHESQSRLWENFVGRSLPMWRHFYRPLQAAFPSLADVSLTDWHFAINNVRPSLIRVEADEVTYGLHIMLRFELERSLLDAKLAVRDVPAAWNDGMRDLLGVTPPRDALGCLQDIHWSQGTFGYFPTYLLGTLYAAQLFAAAQRAMPDLDQQIERGELAPLRSWLRTSVHQHGRRYRAGELVQRISGEAPSDRPFVEYLRGKFRPLYGLDR